MLTAFSTRGSAFRPISDYANLLEFTTSTQRELPLEAAVSRIHDLYYEAHSCHELLRHVRPPLKEARRDLWTCGLIHQRIINLRSAHFMQTRRDRPPSRT